MITVKLLRDTSIHALLLAFSLIAFPCHSYGREYTSKEISESVELLGRSFVWDPERIIYLDTERNIKTIINNSKSQVAVIILPSFKGDEPSEYISEHIFEMHTAHIQILYIADRHFISIETAPNINLSYSEKSDIIEKQILPHIQNDPDFAITNGLKSIVNQPEKTKIKFNNIKKYYIYLSICVFLVFLIRLIITLTKKIPNIEKHYLLSGIQLSITKFWIFVTPFLLIPLYAFILYKRKQIRTATVYCTCGNAMHRLNNEQEQIYLSKDQRTQQKDDTADYDIWLCTSCNNTTALPYKILRRKK